MDKKQIGILFIGGCIVLILIYNMCDKIQQNNIISAQQELIDLEYVYIHNLENSLDMCEVKKDAFLKDCRNTIAASESKEIDLGLHQIKGIYYDFSDKVPTFIGFRYFGDFSVYVSNTMIISCSPEYIPDSIKKEFNFDLGYELDTYADCQYMTNLSTDRLWVVSNIDVNDDPKGTLALKICNVDSCRMDNITIT